MRNKSLEQWNVCRKYLNEIEPEIRIALGTELANNMEGVKYFKQGYCFVREYGDYVTFNDLLRFLSEINGVVTAVRDLTRYEIMKYDERISTALAGADGDMPEIISMTELKRRSDIVQHLVEVVRSATIKQAEDEQMRQLMEYCLQRDKKEISFIIKAATKIKLEKDAADKEGQPYEREWEVIKEVVRQNVMRINARSK